MQWNRADPHAQLCLTLKDGNCPAILGNGPLYLPSRLLLKAAQTWCRAWWCLSTLHFSDWCKLLRSVLCDAPTSGFLILSKHKKDLIKPYTSQNAINRRLNKMFSWHLYYFWIFHFKRLLHCRLECQRNKVFAVNLWILLWFIALHLTELFQARLHSWPKIPTGIWQGWGHRRHGDKSEEPTREVSDLFVAERTQAKNSYCGFVIYKPCHYILKIKSIGFRVFFS